MKNGELVIKSNVKGVSTVISLGDNIMNVAFDKNTSCEDLFDIMKSSSFEGYMVHVLAPDYECIKEHWFDFNFFHEVRSVEQAISSLKFIADTIYERIEDLKKSMCKTYKEHNIKNGALNQMPPIIICFAEADNILKEKSKEVENLLNEIIKFGGAVGVSIILQSHENKRIEKSLPAGYGSLFVWVDRDICNICVK